MRYQLVAKFDGQAIVTHPLGFIELKKFVRKLFIKKVISDVQLSLLISLIDEIVEEKVEAAVCIDDDIEASVEVVEPELARNESWA